MDAVPAFTNNAAIEDQTYTQKIEISAPTLPQATGGIGDLTYTLKKSDGTALLGGLTFDSTMRVLAGRPQAGTAVGTTDYTLTATDRDDDEDELIFSITYYTGGRF
ncbi:MAG: putative Ig domain-containing protein [Ekhidna sp.]|nr:putative Ig domain-containing protein [Ekhidna sp.]